jgi:hypothetical protein
MKRIITALVASATLTACGNSNSTTEYTCSPVPAGVSGLQIGDVSVSRTNKMLNIERIYYRNARYKVTISGTVTASSGSGESTATPSPITGQISTAQQSASIPAKAEDTVIVCVVV